MSRQAIAAQRKALGIKRDERNKKDRAWVAAVQSTLGKIPDAEVAIRVGKSAAIVAAARTELRITRAPKKSHATSEVRERFAKLSSRELRKLLARMAPIDAAILCERLIAVRPATLAQIGARFGVRRQRVAQRERRAANVNT